MRKLALALLVPILAVSCATVDQAALSDPSLRSQLPPLKLDVGFDIFLARVDLRRGMHDEIELRDNLTERVVRKENEYHPLVVDLGGGLILDYNGNLCLDLFRLYGLAGAPSFKVDSKGERFGAARIVYEKGDGKYRIEKRQTGTKVERGTITETSATASDRSHDILIDDEGVKTNMRNFLGMRSSASIKKYSDSEVAIPALIGEAFFVLEDGFIELDKKLAVAHKGDRIEFDAKGVDGLYTFTLVRSGDSVFVYDRNSRGFELRREGDEVVYLVNGKKERTYTLIDRK
jgi:hypothetical protein